MGDAVNLAARLEGTNKAYGTNILVSDSTVARCAPPTGFRELDRVRVVGRAEPVGLYSQLDGQPAADQVDGYEAALADYRAGRFTAAAARWLQLASVDPASAAMAARAQRLDQQPPENWDGVYDLDEK